MTPHLNVRVRRACAGLGALCLAYTIAADTPFAARADSTPATTSSPAATLRHGRVRLGEPAIVQGRVSGAHGGQPVALQFRPAGGVWSTVASSQTASDGRYRMSARLARSGALRVADTGPQARVAALSTAGAPAFALSPERAITVTAAITPGRRSTDVLAGQRATLAGTILPAVSGRRVALQILSGRRWVTVAHDRAGARGRFRLSYVPHRAGSERIQVRFDGDRVNGPASRIVGHLNAFRSVGASWYGGGGGVACSGMGGVSMGVAHKTLACGTHLVLRYGGRSVGVTVIDRGPFVAGREFDLTPGVKSALGFGDTGNVWSTR